MKNFKFQIKKIPFIGNWIIGLLVFIGLLGYFRSPVFAQGLGCGEGFGVIAKVLCPGGKTTDSKTEVGDTLNSVIGNIIGFLTIIAGLWFMIQLIIGGYTWINAGGDKQRVQTAWSKIHQATLGLTIVVAAWVIVGLFGQMLGLEILNPGTVIQNLKLQ